MQLQDLKVSFEILKNIMFPFSVLPKCIKCILKNAANSFSTSYTIYKANIVNTLKPEFVYIRLLAFGLLRVKPAGM